MLTSVRFGEQAYLLVIRLVVRELFKKCLSKVPHGYCGMLSRVRGIDLSLGAASANQKRVILLRYPIREVSRLDELVRFVVRTNINGHIGQYVIRVANLDWLIDEEQVRLVVPAPGVQISCL